MSYSSINSSAATLTKNRSDQDVVPISGMCVTCVDGCIGMCEIGKSAFRGSEVIYPQPFGVITVASEKNYPLDYSHFTILGTLVGAEGERADSNHAIFPNAKLETHIGGGLKFRYPWIIPGLGSTDIAKMNWDGLAIGAALSGVAITIGENVAGMDPEIVLDYGKVVDSVDLKRRVRLYKEYQRGDYGAVIVQANVEDTRLGVHEYAIEKLGVECVELKWGQGAKDIGGEVKIRSLKRAQMLHDRGYLVYPDPTNADAIERFNRGAIKEFERHSRVDVLDEAAFAKRVETLRKFGAKFISLKTGAYRPRDLAYALSFASKYKLDLVTIDAAGGGSAMSPMRMMNESGIPPVELHSLTHRYAAKLAARKVHLPAIAVSGGITFEDQIFKALALGSPYVKLVGMARGPLAATMVGKTIGRAIEENQLPVYIERFGHSKEEIFSTADALRKELGADEFDRLPTGAIGLYTYFERLGVGLQQLMAGSRKFALEHISRGDIAALTRHASDVSGIDFISDVDHEEAERILAA